MPQEDQKKNGKPDTGISNEFNGKCGKVDETDKWNDIAISRLAPTRDEQDNWKMKDDSDDKYSTMNEKITAMGKRVTMLEDLNNRGSEMKANDMEDNKTQEARTRKEP